MNNPEEPAAALTKGFNNFLRAREKERRRKATAKCPICDEELRAETREDVEQHYDDKHPAGQDSELPQSAEILSLLQISDTWPSPPDTGRRSVIRPYPRKDAIQHRPRSKYPDSRTR
ncbi:hypothetical protein LY78DRAFT_591686 [Colletotrichum sublineola]|nr:hypothetical protein LY78DRAFT_591686 [Colletotrichum sublineola]